MKLDAYDEALGGYGQEEVVRYKNLKNLHRIVSKLMKA